MEVWSDWVSSGHGFLDCYVFGGDGFSGGSELGHRCCEIVCYWIAFLGSLIPWRAVDRTWATSAFVAIPWVQRQWLPWVYWGDLLWFDVIWVLNVCYPPRS